MKTLYVLLLLFLFKSHLFSQSLNDFSVLVTATADTTAPSITLQWEADAAAQQYTVYRKSKTAQSWGTSLAQLPGTAVKYSDENVSKGVGYEYKIFKTANGYNGEGYIYAGMNLLPEENRGTMMLIVADTYAEELSSELERLEMDLMGDGWNVARRDVSPTATVQEVKNIVLSVNTPLNAVFLFGKVPVPYSGDIAPDGHSDHWGAWPADAFYGDLDGTWTDSWVSDNSADWTANHNVPSDGKFDNSSYPSEIDIPVGRVDLSNLTVFTANEETLLRRYLDKNHNFRHKITPVQERALVADFFGEWFYNQAGEIFAESSVRSFWSMFGKYSTGEYFPTLINYNYLWAYFAGPGFVVDYDVSGIFNGLFGSSQVIYGSTYDFDYYTVKSVFNVFMGSYFGDWNMKNNFLRAFLASRGNILTNCWSGRPAWYFHHMALGEPISFSAKLSQNNYSLYEAGLFTGSVHTGLMGDPTLRMHIIAPPSAISLTDNGTSRTISWQPSPDPVLGYYVYRADNKKGLYSRISPSEIAGTSCIDNDAVACGDSCTYMVRALALTESSSGTYYNLSQGVFGAVYDNTGVIADKQISIRADVYPSPAGSSVHIDIGNISSSGFPAAFSLYDVTGKKVKTEKLVFRSSEITRGDLPSGLYYFELTGRNGESVSGRIVFE